MRARLGLIACVAVGAALVVAAVEPRLHYAFPSVIDDWVGIRDAADQLPETLRLGSPEPQRYRPGFIVWEFLQWHTFGAPERLVVPYLWGLLRIAVFVIGVPLLAALLVGRLRPGLEGRDPRGLLVAGVPVAALTAPSLAIDLARYGPQEPLLIGCMSLGVVLLVPLLDRILAGRGLGRLDLVAAPVGVLLWAFGVLQKETSLCVLLVVPFLVPLLRAQRPRWTALDGGRRLWIVVLGGAVALPFVPMLLRTARLALADERLYGEIAAQKPLIERLADQLTRVSEVMHSHLPAAIVIAAVALVVLLAVRSHVDWLAVGLLVSGLGFVLFAAEGGVVTSRYYLPTVVLAALALSRAAVALGPRVVAVAGASLLALGTLQAVDARGYVRDWVATEEAREELVREAAARIAAGCEVGYTGLNVELVEAVPLLVPLAREPGRDCATGERFVVQIDPGGPGTETPPDDPVLAACVPETTPAYASEVGKIVRCTA